MLTLARFPPPMPAKIIGMSGGGTPFRNESWSIVCSILRCSSRRPSCRVFSSSCLRFSSSALVTSQFRIDSSAPCHCAGGAGIPVN